MKIVFDANPICADKLTGIGYSQKEICRALMDLYPDETYQMNYFSLTDRKGKHKRMSKYIKGNTDLKEFPLLSAGIYKLIYGFVPLPYRMMFGRGDITHFFNFLIPPGVKGKKVCTIHDLAFIRYPDTVNLRTRRMLHLNIKRTIKRADKIFVVSEFTGKELKELYGVGDSKICVVYNAIDRELYRPITMDEQGKGILKKYGIEDKNYILYLGTIEPRKNLERLITAYARTVEKLKRCEKDIPPLVLAGKLGWYYDKILERIKAEGIEDRVKMPGYVPDEDKPYLYSSALAFAFPSLYEGFGMPVIEAMACGAPVLTSNVSSLPEVAGNCAVLCDPLSEFSIAKGLYRLITEPELREELTEKGLERSRHFTWEESAKKTYEVYRSLLGK